MRKRLSPDYQLRQKLQYILINKIILKSIQRSNGIFLPIMHKGFTKARVRFQKYGKIHNFCSVTGRGRSIISKFKMSRNMFKLSINHGLFYGMRKASW